MLSSYGIQKSSYFLLSTLLQEDLFVLHDAHFPKAALETTMDTQSAPGFHGEQPSGHVHCCHHTPNHSRSTEMILYFRVHSHWASFSLSKCALKVAVAPDCSGHALHGEQKHIDSQKRVIESFATQKEKNKNKSGTQTINIIQKYIGLQKMCPCVYL